MTHGYSADKDAVLARLKKVEGQVRGIARMVDDDTYCIDVLTQVSAATRALENVALLLLEDHLDHCVRDAAVAGRPRGRREDRRGERRHRPPRPFLSTVLSAPQEEHVMSTTTWTVTGHDLRPLRQGRHRGDLRDPRRLRRRRRARVRPRHRHRRDRPDAEAVAAAVDEAGYTLVTA